MNEYQHNLITQFIKISQYAGMREDVVQAGGGNSSVKISPNRMLIKASGYQLADIREGQGYSVVDPQKITAFFRDRGVKTLDANIENQLLEQSLVEGKRPSIETFLHCITDVLTLHTHPVAVNILTMRKGGMDILKELVPDALLVGYETPGIKLAQKYFSSVYQDTAERMHPVIFLKNHGMIVTGRTADEVIGKTEEVLHILEEHLQLNMAVQHQATHLWQAFEEAGQEGIVWTVTDRNVLAAYQKFGGGWHYDFCPDCLVYCGKRMLQIAPGELPAIAIRKHMQQFGPAVVVIWKNTLYIHAVNVKKAMDIQSVLSFSAQIMQQNAGVDCDFLSEEEQNFLLHWDAEKYRQSL